MVCTMLGKPPVLDLKSSASSTIATEKLKFKIFGTKLTK